MELDQFIKQDIQRFLDERAAAQHGAATSEPSARKAGVLSPEEVMLYAPDHDYVKELDEALQRRDIEKAKKIIYGFKDAYEKYAPNSPEWEEGKRIFKSLYMAFRNAMAQDEQRQEELLKQELEHGLSIGRSEQSPAAASQQATQQAAPQARPAPQQPEPQSSQQPSSQQPAPQSSPPSQAPKPTNAELWQRLDQYAQEARRPGPERPAMPKEEEQQLAQRIDAAERLLAAGKVHDALAAYKALSTGLSPEQLSREQRARYLPRLLTLYRRIHEAVEETNSSRSVFATALNHTKEALDHGDLRTAMSEHRHATTAFAHLPPSEQAAKRHLITDLYGEIKSRMAV